MREDLVRRVREALEDVFPYLAMPGKVGEIVEELVKSAGEMGELVRALEIKAGEAEERELKTDITILLNRIEEG